MYEKVNPAHPDKIADRIAGALVDLAYQQEVNPRIAAEVMVGHGICHIIVETSVHLDTAEVQKAVNRIAGEGLSLFYQEVSQDGILAKNQKQDIRCGDNGIFRGVPVTPEQHVLSIIARDIYRKHPTDGKYIMDGDRLIICKSNADKEELE